MARSKLIFILTLTGIGLLSLFPTSLSATTQSRFISKLESYKSEELRNQYTTLILGAQDQPNRDELISTINQTLAQRGELPRLLEQIIRDINNHAPELIDSLTLGFSHPSFSRAIRTHQMSYGPYAQARLMDAITELGQTIQFYGTHFGNLGLGENIVVGITQSKRHGDASISIPFLASMMMIELQAILTQHYSQPGSSLRGEAVPRANFDGLDTITKPLRDHPSFDDFSFKQSGMAISIRQRAEEVILRNEKTWKLSRRIMFADIDRESLFFQDILGEMSSARFVPFARRFRRAKFWDRSKPDTGLNTRSCQGAFKQ